MIFIGSRFYDIILRRKYMKRFIPFIIVIVLIPGCSQCNSKADEGDEFVWNDWGGNIERENPFVIEAFISPEDGGEPDNTIVIRMSHKKILEAGYDTLDTQFTPQILKDLEFGYHQVVMTVNITDIQRRWDGHYDCDKEVFITDGGHPDLCPQLDDEIGTFVIILPCEG
jgi:hypothetical protein